MPDQKIADDRYLAAEKTFFGHKILEFRRFWIYLLCCYCEFAVLMAGKGCNKNGTHIIGHT